MERRLSRLEASALPIFDIQPIFDSPGTVVPDIWAVTPPISPDEGGLTTGFDRAYPEFFMAQTVDKGGEEERSMPYDAAEGDPDWSARKGKLEEWFSSNADFEDTGRTPAVFERFTRYHDGQGVTDHLVGPRPSASACGSP